MPRVMIHAAGNVIEATEDMPFPQIGGHRYGKPILDRAVRPDTTLVNGVRLALVSMDSTLHSNLAVGMPLDLPVYRVDTQAVALRMRITEGEPCFRSVRDGWPNSLREAHRGMPAPGRVPG